MSGFNTDDTGGFGAMPGKQKEPFWDANIKWFQFPDDGQLYRYRLVGNPTHFYNHWISTKKKDGTVGKAIPVLCKNWNAAASKFEENGCKACEVALEFRSVYGAMNLDYTKWADPVKRMQAKSTMAINAIVRDLQQQGPPGNQKDWTYIHPIKLPKGLSETIVDLATKINKKPAATTDTVKYWGFNHAQHGRDLQLSYNSQADAAKMYMVIPDAGTPLTPEEMAQAGALVDFVPHLKYWEDFKLQELLQRGGFYDTLNSLKAQQSLSSTAKISAPQGATEIPKTEPGQAQTPVTAQVAPPVQAPAAFQTNDHSFNPDEQFPDTLLGTSPVPVQAPIAASPAIPVVPVAPVVQQAAVPVAPPVVEAVATPPPVAAPVAATPVAEGSSVLPQIDAFVKAFNKGLKLNSQDYSDLALRTVTVGTMVPECFSLYTESRRLAPESCKACPIKLDCMQVEA